MPAMADDAMIRRKNLIRLGKTPSELVAILGRTPSYWSDLIRNQKKSFGEKIARSIEDGWPLPRGWLDQVHDDDAPIPEPGNEGVAQSLSQPGITLPLPRTWEEVMHRERMPVWPEEVTIVVPDRALEPHVMKGDYLTFEACLAAEPTSVVVLELDDGSRWVRRLVTRADGTLWGVATSDAFPDFKATKILARATRRASPFTGF